MKVVIVNGAPESGKSSFESMCSYMLGPYYRSRSTVDRIKEIAIYAGWNGVKDLSARRLLSDLKDAFTLYNDLPFNDVVKSVNAFEEELAQYVGNSSKAVFFIDDREPEHIERLKKELDAVTVLIRRETAENHETSNHADANILNYDYDYIIDNNGTYEELKDKAKSFLKEIGIKI